MKSTRITHLRIVCAALLCGLAPLVAAPAADATIGAAQQLLAPKASSKVAAVFWTRRSDRYTLQVAFPRPTTGTRIQPIKNSATVSLWLLKADGTAIPTAMEPSLSHTTEVAYAVPLAAGEAAVAAVLKIDEEYFIEALRSLK